MLLLSGVDGDGSYVGDVLPGMLVAGLGLGIALVSVALSVLTGAADDEAGMLSGLNTTGHEIGGSLGVAILVTIATAAMGTGTPASTAGLDDAFTVSGVIAAAAAVVALFVLPSAASFLPKLRLAPRVAIH
jgi:sugar phosphate permease